MVIEDDLEAVGRMTVAMSCATSATEIFAEALRAIRVVGRAPRSAVLLFDDDGVMRFKAWDGLSQAYRDRVEGHTPWKPGQPHPEPILVADVATDEVLRPFLDVIRAEGISAMLMVPLVTGGGTIGKFMLYFDGACKLDRQQTALVENIAAHTAFAVDRQRVLDALRASEERYRSVVDQLEEVVFQLDPDGTIRFLSAAWKQITGRPITDSLGTAWIDHVTPGERDGNCARLRAVVGGQVACARYETSIPRADGVRWVAVVARPTHDPRREDRWRLGHAQRHHGASCLHGGAAGRRGAAPRHAATRVSGTSCGRDRARLQQPPRRHPHQRVHGAGADAA